MKTKWTKKEIETALKTNVKDYGSAIAVAALYKKLYGEFPKIGLSGHQGSVAEAFLERLPDTGNADEN